TTSALLSDISGAAGMVMIPRREPRLAQMSLVALDPTRALAVLVGEAGSLENRVLGLPPGTSAGALQEASNYITARLAGRTLAARHGARGGGHARLHRQRESAVRADGVVGGRRGVARRRGEGDRRAGSDRADAVELRAGRAHGGFHRPFEGESYRLINRRSR